VFPPSLDSDPSITENIPRISRVHSSMLQDRWACQTRVVTRVFVMGFFLFERFSSIENERQIRNKSKIKNLKLIWIMVTSY